MTLRRFRSLPSGIVGLMFAGVAASAHAVPIEHSAPRSVQSLVPSAIRHATPCVDGMADIYPCSNIDLYAFVPVGDFSATSTNSLWGWTDPQTSTEYALIGADNAIAFYDLSQPDHPRYLGRLPTHAGTGSSAWRDVRVYANHAYIVSDNNGAHGMQVFDLTQLRTVITAQTFSETAHDASFRNGHTISINEDTGYAYVAGSNTCGTASARGGLRMYDLTVPHSPAFVGCVSEGGYTHEAQCWTYAGPDTRYSGHEICINANGPTKRVAIVDVTNKSAPVTLSSSTYAGAAYPHQGWLTEDHRYLLVNDELDESNFGHNARTLVWDVSNLEAPVLVGHHEHPLSVIDHNLYVHGNFVYQSNYEAGLRILRLDNLSQAAMTEVAYFDVFPDRDTPNFNGTWNNYRFPGSGIVVVTSIDEGFFVLKPQLCEPQAAPTGLVATAAGNNLINLQWAGNASAYRIERAQGGCNGSFETVADGIVGNVFTDNGVSGLIDFGYRVVAAGNGNQCASAASSCVVAQTTGACTAPPIFAGLNSANDARRSNCRIDLDWNPAAPACGDDARYSVYRSSLADFTPDASNRIAADITGSIYADLTALSGVKQFYVVRSTDPENGQEDSNRIERSSIAQGPLVDGVFGSGAEPGEPPFDTSADGPALQRAGESVLHAGWHMSTSHVRSGTQSFWSTAANNLCVSLVTPSITLSAGELPSLKFWQLRDIQPGRDGGVIEISNDGGSSWTRLTPIGGYPSTITGGGELCGIRVGDGAYSESNALTWIQAEVDLAEYAGQDVQLRWMYRTDASQTGEGWFIDDIEVKHAQVPGVCVSSSDVIFKNGFD
jgi:choice-of-anchor B domain-containing protein